MNLAVLTLGAYQTNTYVLWPQGGENCLVIDPGYAPDRILDYVNQQNLTIEAILLTHGHFDHVGGVRELAAETDCRVFIHEADTALPPTITDGPLYHTDFYDEGSSLTLAGLSFTVMHTPGHTPGSVCLFFPVGTGCDTVMFAGDTLFAGSCGRTDLPGGNLHQMRASLKRLAEMTHGNFYVYSGHGPRTTLREEQFHNPYLAGGSL